MKKLIQLFPILQIFHTHRAVDFFMDIVAGFVLSVVLIPEGIAYASLAGVPPAVGIFSVTFPVLIYALIGPSKQMVVASAAVISLMVADTLSGHQLTTEQYVTCATLLALFSGIFLMLLSAFKAGHLENFISESVLIGFTAAAALIIGATQLSPLVGIPKNHDSHNVFMTI